MKPSTVNTLIPKTLLCIAKKTKKTSLSHTHKQCSSLGVAIIRNFCFEISGRQRERGMKLPSKEGKTLILWS